MNGSQRSLTLMDKFLAKVNPRRALKYQYQHVEDKFLARFN